MEWAFEEGHLLHVSHAALETETGIAAAFKLCLVFLSGRRVLVLPEGVVLTFATIRKQKQFRSTIKDLLNDTFSRSPFMLSLSITDNRSGRRNRSGRGR